MAQLSKNVEVVLATSDVRSLHSILVANNVNIYFKQPTYNKETNEISATSVKLQFFIKLATSCLIP